MRPELEPKHRSGLVDLLDRVLDKGLVVAGDIKVSLAEVELLTIRVRLLICSVDKALEIGLDWWKHDKHLSGTGKGLALENEALREQVKTLEARLSRRALTNNGKNGARAPAKVTRKRRRTTTARRASE